MRNFVLFALALFVLLLAMSSRVFAQVNTVNLSGTVLDPQNLAVSNAHITVQNLATGAQRTAISDANGRYDIVGLPPGKYSFTVEASGFAVLINPSLTLILGVSQIGRAHV